MSKEERIQKIAMGVRLYREYRDISSRSISDGMFALDDIEFLLSELEPQTVAETIFDYEAEVGNFHVALHHNHGHEWLKSFVQRLHSPAPDTKGLETKREEGICDECRQEYPTPWFAANPLWNRVIPDRVGMLCPNCFIRKAQSVIGESAWEVREEVLPSAPSTSSEFETAMAESAKWLTWALDRVSMGPGGCTFCGWPGKSHTVECPLVLARNAQALAESALTSYRERK